MAIVTRVGKAKKMLDQADPNGKIMFFLLNKEEDIITQLQEISFLVNEELNTEYYKILMKYPGLMDFLRENDPLK